MTESAEILFISDLHLDRDEPEISRRFLDFLETRASQARVLYILGDLFEVWLGDDDEATHFQPVFDALLKLAGKTEIIFVHGNRDFLVGDELAARTGMTIGSEPISLQLGNSRVGLMHGDLLCTDDVDYQRFRQMVRQPAWQQQFLSRSLTERRQVAAALRDQSSAAMAQKSSQIMDVNPQTVSEFFRTLKVDILIHGHTHRPGIQQLSAGQQRIVLGDWQPGPSYLSWRNDHFHLADDRC